MQINIHTYQRMPLNVQLVPIYDPDVEDSNVVIDSQLLLLMAGSYPAMFQEACTIVKGIFGA
jgi:hypothetical protein